MTDTSMRRLPPLPPTIRPLKTDESTGLNRRYPASQSTLGNCITCKGTKTFRWYGADNEVVTYECSCADQYLLSRWLWNSGVLPKYQRLGWRDFERLPEDVALAVAGYLDVIEQAVDNGLGLRISGPKGNGKTLLAHLLIKEIIARGVGVYATSFTQMIDVFAKGWRDDEQGRWFDRRLRDAPVLLIDDLGRERNKGEGSVGENMLETVIRHRVACSMPTIITTNIEDEHLGAAYGGHTESLLSECSLPLRVSGSDVRQQMLQRMQAEMKQGITRPVVLR